MKIFRNNKTTTEEVNQHKNESIISLQLFQLNEREQHFLGLMKKADTINRPIEELLASSCLTQHKKPEIPEIQQQKTLTMLHTLLDFSEILMVIK